MAERRGSHHETDVLLRQIDGHLARLGARRTAPLDELPAAERIAAALRRLVIETTHASAHDRARVRAAVHVFVVRRSRRPARPLGGDIRVINEIAGQIGRADLIPPLPAPVRRASVLAAPLATPA